MTSQLRVPQTSYHRLGEITSGPDNSSAVPGRLLGIYAWLLGPLLAGYLLFDKAFAYIHVPGTPLYVGELVLMAGIIGLLATTAYLWIPMRDEPILAILAAFILWGLIRLLPGLSTYGINAIRDSALWYYCSFAFLAIAVLVRSPSQLERLLGLFSRLIPWLLLWLPVAVILARRLPSFAPNIPFTSVSIFTHKPGDAAIGPVLVLGYLWLFPDKRSARSSAMWSILALLVIAVTGTQNRGGLLCAVAGIMVGLLFVRDRMRLIVKAIAVTSIGLGVAALLSLQISATGSSIRNQRMFSAQQLMENVASIAGAQANTNLSGTVAGRKQLWSRVVDIQIAEGRILYGSGFGPNLAYEAGVYSADPSDPMRSPHNSYIDILARMGLVGLSLWIALWVGWYWRMFAGCNRLARYGLNIHRKVAVLCMMTTTAFLVSSFFDPQFEGAQVAALVWTAFGIGVAVTSRRQSLRDSSIATVNDKALTAYEQEHETVLMRARHLAISRAGSDSVSQ